MIISTKTAKAIYGLSAFQLLTIHFEGLSAIYRISTCWSVLRLSVYPKFTYILKFTNHSMHDLNELSGPLRNLIRQKTNASHLPNAILFSGNSTAYSLPYYDLMTHTVKEKESTMLRMLSGSAQSRQTIHSLLCRGQRLISENCSFINNPTPCPQLPYHLQPSQQSHYCWAHSLIQYLQAANSNIHTASRFPTTSPPYTITQTPIHTSYNQTLDSPLTLADIFDFESSYHLYFIEELFTYPLQHPNTYIDCLTVIFPPQYQQFLKRIILANYDNRLLSLGQLIAREHLLLQLPSSKHPTYIEGLLNPHNDNHSRAALTRTWALIHQHQSKQTSFLRIYHNNYQIPTINPIPTTPYRTKRYIHSALGYTKTYSTCKVLSLNQLIVPRHHSPFSEIYSPPIFACTPPQEVKNAWDNFLSYRNAAPTDGSFRPQDPLTTLQSTEESPDVFTSIVFSTTPSTDIPWSQREVTALRIAFPKPTTANNYTAEVLGVAVASTLHKTRLLKIYTDAKGIITSINKSANQYTSSPLHTTPHLPRNYTETGLLYQHILQQHHRLEIHHVKAHQEDSSRATQTEHGTGNRIADLIAQGNLFQAQNIVPNLRVYTTNTCDLINSPPIQPLIRIGPTPLSHDYSLHHPNHTQKIFLSNRINDWLTNIRPNTSRLSTHNWKDLSRNLAGTAINQYSKNTRTKLFLMKTLYDALPNDYTKYKYASRPQRTNYESGSQDPNLPICPLCATFIDSLSHLFCQCTYSPLSLLRDELTRKLSTLVTSIHYSNPLIFPVRQLTNLIIHNFSAPQPDHRNLLGLFHPPTQFDQAQSLSPLKSALRLILPETIPFLQQAWKLYCAYTHSQLQNTQDTHNPAGTFPIASSRTSPRLIILSGNNATMSLQTVHDLPPSNYTRRSKPQTRQHRFQHQPSQRTILQIFPNLKNSILPLIPEQIPLPAPSSSPPISPDILLTSPPPSSVSSHPRTQHSSSNNPYININLSRPRHTFYSNRPNTSPITQNSASLAVASPPSQSSPYSHLPVYDPPPIDDLEFPLPFPYQSASSLAHLKTHDMREILSKLKLHAHDVPQNGDCFYLAIQLHFIKARIPPHLVSIPILRKSIYNLLTQSATGKEICRDYQVNVQQLAPNILPSL